MSEKTSLEEFRKEYMSGEKYFDFTLFTIVCNKCNSKDVEFGGKAQLDYIHCYYSTDRPHIKNTLICKCHSCGNASTMCIKDFDEIYEDVGGIKQ